MSGCLQNTFHVTSREVTHTGKSPFLGSHSSREVIFPGKSNFPGSLIFGEFKPTEWEVSSFFYFVQKKDVRGAISQNLAMEFLQDVPQINAFGIPDHMALTDFMDVNSDSVVDCALYISAYQMPRICHSWRMHLKKRD